MAEEIGAAYFTILPSLRDFPGAIRSGVAPVIATESKQAGTAYGHGFAGAFLTTLKYSAAYGVITTIGRGFGLLGRSIFGFNSNLQASTIAFTTMLGSAQKAEAFLNKLLIFAKTTPFDVPGVIQASQQLLAYGFSAQQVLPALTAIGDAAAGLGGGADALAHITLAIGQIQAKGRVQAQEILQLTNAGVPAIRILANEFGVSAFNMQKLITKGLVPAQKAIPALLLGLETGTDGLNGKTAAFGGLMEKQSHTFLGALSNIRDALNITASTAFRPLFDTVSGGLNKLADFLGSKGFASRTKAFAAGVAAIISRISGAFSGVQQHFLGTGTLLHQLGGVLSRLGGSFLSTFKAIGHTISQNKEGLRDFAIIVGVAWGTLLTAVTKIIPILGLAIRATITAIAKISKAFIDNLPAIATFFSTMLHWDALLVHAFVFVAEAGIKAFGKILQAASHAFGWVPGIGEKLKESSFAFDSFAQVAVVALNQVAAGADNLAASVAAMGAAIAAARAAAAADAATGLDFGPGSARGDAARRDANKKAGKQAGKDAGQSAADAIRKAFSGLGGSLSVPKDKAKGGGGTSSQGIANPIKFVANLGKSIVHELTAGIAGSSDLLVKMAATALDKLKAAAKEKLPSGLHKEIERALGLEQTFNHQLNVLAAERGKVADRLKAAQDKLSSIRQTYADYVTQVRTTLSGSTLQNAFTAATATSGPVTSFQHALLGQETTARSLLAAIRKLKAAGLQAALIDQIIQAGPETGLQIANELLLEGSTGISAANHVQSQLDKLGKSLGSVGADSLYDAGIRAAQGLVAGLKSQEKALDAQMDRLARHMVSTIKHTLGIHSPSAVFRDEVGLQIGLGTAAGITASRRHVTAASSGLVTVPRIGSALAAGGGSAGRSAPLIGEQNIYEAHNPHAAARASVAALNRATRRLIPA